KEGLADVISFALNLIDRFYIGNTLSIYRFYETFFYKASIDFYKDSIDGSTSLVEQTIPTNNKLSACFIIVSTQHGINRLTSLFLLLAINKKR
ncbi:MAG: hypothetical protein IKV71_05605, partial [Psychrobacter sp.]|nr:hypothetical protein [Psychrobacter sp.]